MATYYDVHSLGDKLKWEIRVKLFIKNRLTVAAASSIASEGFPCIETWTTEGRSVMSTCCATHFKAERLKVNMSESK